MSVEIELEKCKWGGRYDLIAARQRQYRKPPAQHQTKALARLRDWYLDDSPGDRGAILVLPTGAGKTFTAVSFLCEHPITRGHKVLWLAHSHHLLEQASRAFEDALPLVGGHKPKLTVRVVSGGAVHCKVHQIESEDDVVVSSLQAAALAFNTVEHPALCEFLDAACDNLFVVFDEAHHSPAPSYWCLGSEFQ